MRITPENGAAALEKIKAAFDEVAALLADGRPYLTGASFTAADLSFASLAAPALGQPYACAPALDADTPAAMREQLEELRAHPAGRFALRLWAEERGAVLR
jgi:glutathione S-transferase